MKLKNLFVAVGLSLALAVAPAAVQAADEQSEGPQMLVMSQDSSGICALFGSQIIDGDLFLLLAYRNDTANNNYPGTAFSVHAFQDGIALKDSYSFSKPSGFEYSSITLVQPGTVVAYHDAFQLSSQSPVEVQIKPLIDFTGEKTVSYTIPYEDLNKGVAMGSGSQSAPATETVAETSPAAAPAATETAPAAEGDDWQGKYYDLLEKYNALQEKHSELQEKYNALLESNQQ